MNPGCDAKNLLLSFSFKRSKKQEKPEKLSQIKLNKVLKY
jgi:hypothetical protein